MMKKKLLQIIILGLCSGILGACSYIPDFGSGSKLLSTYRPDVHQGNLITKEMLSELKVGMTSAQVQFLLGVPLVKDQFHTNRWDYVYYLNPRYGETESRRLSVFFDDMDRVKKFEYSNMPTEMQADKIILNQENEFKNNPKDLVVVGEGTSQVEKKNEGKN